MAKAKTDWQKKAYHDMVSIVAGEALMDLVSGTMTFRSVIDVATRKILLWKDGNL